MSIKANIKVGGGCTISLEAETPVEIIKAASQFSQLPKKCGQCGSHSLEFSHRTAGDSGQYDYLHLKCSDCGATCDIGQTQVPKGNIFYKHQPKDRTNVKEGFYKYWEQDHGSGNAPAPASRPEGAPSSLGIDDDDGAQIPF